MTGFFELLNAIMIVLLSDSFDAFLITMIAYINSQHCVLKIIRVHPKG